MELIFYRDDKGALIFLGCVTSEERGREILDYCERNKIQPFAAGKFSLSAPSTSSTSSKKETKE